MINSIKMQFTELLGKKTVIITYCILMGFMIVNFIDNMLDYAEVKYVSEMYDPIKMLTLSTWSESGFYLRMFYPILVCIPTSVAYLTDRGTRVMTYIESRTGRKKYIIGKAVAVFLVTFLVFTVPFLLEFILSCICFKMDSLGDPSNISYIDIAGHEYGYFMPQLWLENRIIYVIFMIAMFGIVSGILAVFNFSVCTLPIFKYKIFTFFPIYIMFHIIGIIDKVAKFDFETNYFMLISMFDKSDKWDGIYFIFMVGLLLISVLIIRNKKEEII